MDISKSKIEKQLLGSDGWAEGSALPKGPALLLVFVGHHHPRSYTGVLIEAGGQETVSRGPGLQPL